MTDKQCVAPLLSAQGMLAGLRFPATSRFTLPLLLAGLLVCPLLAQADNNNAQLHSIQQDIAQKEKSVRAQQLKRSALLSQLRSQEKRVAQASRQLHQTQTALADIQGDIGQLTDSINQLTAQQSREQALLAAQLDAAFRQGQHSGLQLLLSGEEGQRSDRILTYFGYLNAERQQNIRSLKATRTELAAKKTLLKQRQQQQQSLLSQQQTQQSKLQQALNARQGTLQRLESSLQQDQEDLVQMRQNESRLQAQIARAAAQARARAEREAREAEQVKKRQQHAKASGSTYHPSAGERELIARTGGLGKASQRYSWPVRGTLLHRFGETLQGELRWKGLVISATEGSEVKAIAEGRVLMADWLQGYGLVVVIEHGKGDMSLYGYNQSALVNVGDQVHAGQPIALVGSSGNQGRPALYFEIRRQGQAVNPLSWLGQ